jgi:hypothetical protein
MLKLTKLDYIKIEEYGFFTYQFCNAYVSTKIKKFHFMETHSILVIIVHYGFVEGLAKSYIFFV